LFLLVLLGLAGAANGQTPAPQEPENSAASAPISPEDPTANWQLVQQETLPNLESRRRSAEARTAAIEGILRGELELHAGLPHLADAPLSSPAWLATARSDLDQRVRDRLSEASTPGPELPSEDEASQLDEAIRGVLSAEEDADAAERRILLALDAQLTAVPALRTDALDPWRAGLVRRRAAAEAAHAAAEDPDAVADAEVDVARAVDDRRRLDALLRLARRHALRPGAPLASPAEDAARAAAGDREARRRLRLRGDFAPDEAVTVALEAAAPAPTPTPAPTPVPVEPDTVAPEVQSMIDRVADRARGAVDRAAAAETQGQFDSSMRKDEIVGAEAHLVDLAAAHSELLGLTSLDPNRRHDAAEAYRSTHDLLTALREGALSAGIEVVALQTLEADTKRQMDAVQDEIEGAREVARSLDPGPAKENIEVGVGRWEDAVAREASAAHNAATEARQHRGRLLTALRETKELRRKLSEDAPPSVRREDARYLFEDVRLELALAGPNLVALAQLRRQQLEALPKALGSFDRVSVLASGALRLLLVLLLWGFLRQRVPDAVQPSLDRYADARDSIFPTDLAGLREPLEKALRAALDLIALSALSSLLRGPLAEASLVLVAVRMVVVYRLAFSLFQLAVARRSRPRPALVRLGPEAHDVATITARALLLWVLFGQLAGYLARDILGADALSELLRLFFTGALLTMTLAGFHLAQPKLFAAAARSRDDVWLERLGPAGGSWITRGPRGLALALALLADATWQVLQGNVDEGSALGRVGNILTRRRLAQRSAASAPELPPLAAKDRWAIIKAPDSLPATHGDSLIEAAQEVFTAWQEEGAQGQMVVVGDRGRGLARQARAVGKALAGDNLKVRKLVIDRRLGEENELEAWFRDALELDDVLPLDQLEGRLGAEPRSVFVIEQLERAFLRRVGGFAALRSLLTLITGSCERHFWILAVHEPAWQYLGRLGTVVHAETFRAVLSLPRVPAASLDEALVARTDAAGFKLDYRHLVARAPEAEDLERARQGYFRLLAEAAEGNPGVALQLWLDSLSCSEDQTTLNVRLPPELASAELPNLTDDELLVLAAVRVHGALTVDELVLVNNVERRTAATTVQNLRARRLVEDDRLGLRLPLVHLPRVTRVLRRRHFLYGTD
jgi:hypothetical protein